MKQNGIEEKLDQKWLGRLVEWGILNVRTLAASRPLLDHVQDWEESPRGQDLLGPQV